MKINRAPYPPIVDDWMHTFVMGDNIKINFSLSAYSNIEDIRTDLILIDIVNSDNNESVIDYAANQGYSQLITNLQIDENNKYYIEISTRLLNIVAGGLYKIQLRFCSSQVTASKQNFQQSLQNGSWNDYISDFSKITLIKIIARPTLELKEFLDVGAKANYIISTAFFSIIGRLKFEDEDGSESLSCYKISLFENVLGTATENDSLIVDTDFIYPDSKELNMIFYTVKKDLKNHANYLMKITYITSSGYQETKEYDFIVEYNTNISTLPPFVFTKLDKEDGSIKVTIKGQENSNYKGFYILRRTSSLSNFTDWEDLKFFRNITMAPIPEIEVIDYLVQSGVFYRYQVIPMDEAGYRGLWADPLGGE